ncbi:ATP-dependent DNA ligase [Rhizorhabdus dicambivorans]|uniref:DNA ligase (ATP) n=2 Tax=Rhizorhabdus dicambivorans TaxID=1850238 RepID=A0A2A4FTK9_9SPHN|nr:ATP-dependent DNA ligase [Rhizorhabdus dicambivorans]PCE41022.1 ATP-dependent DNA ligase [Rhizorhabdus dicambivorans]
MEARLAGDLPVGPGWQYEPKWDGFRAIARRADGGPVSLTSKSGKPLARYFPDVIATLEALDEPDFALDGELVIPIGDHLSFGALQARLHPAASRVARLVREAPAQYVLFDWPFGTDQPLSRRRKLLEDFHRRTGSDMLILSPATDDVEQAHAWLRRSGGALDGVVAKRLDEPYRAGERAMVKVKQLRTADCVVGGYRETAKGEVGSLLLGLYNHEGRLDHVGFTSAFKAAERRALGPMLRPHCGGPGFTGDKPGGPSRWNGGEEKPWIALRPELVVEVIYDQITDGRFRHGTRFHRWRPDKAPGQCDRSQLVRELRPSQFAEILGEASI